MNTAITANEHRVLRALVRNYYGGDFGDATWAYTVNDSEEPSGIVGRSLSGVIASLVKKGWIYCSGDGRDACIGWESAEAHDKAVALGPYKA